MAKVKVNSPFFIFNPKSFLYGEDLLALAKVADQEAQKYPDISVFVTCPYADLAVVAQATDHIIVSAQHLDGIDPGRGMGKVLPESLQAAGARATFLNHAENPMTMAEIVQAIQRADDLDIITIVCADSMKEAQALATLHPDIILCEPTELIGTGQTSDASYIESTNEAIKAIDENILVMQAAGISNAVDVSRTIEMGADGTGCTSGVTKADDPKQMLKDMIEAAAATK
ncbi:triose-phosphate isomerase [Aerococcus urinae]|uniref:triose-phosphate isomerase n=1 Tax=Aerococcus TaxID=1375 RepID=UPI000DCDC663|nr:MULTISPECIES: triose-phosphate isomerase [Aerococcus]MCY3034566.1 triose-phosphate isomerase [Aerococcus mictus]MCY3063520.1 triose-phosphate isomerase [Aerococcus mictus]MCY3072865.1 triose-phosphate isomerase [Aerococcus mictus]MDK7195207.1 triose-phosphate isomerase [Aerococcus urinae]MDK7716394.1 triose-phosphate isomerase [Aerococcus urinae]